MSELLEASEVLLTFANRIRTMRLQLGWSREELAERAGINVYTLKHFERSGQISLERFLKLCAALDSLEEVSRVLKPRQRVNINNWTVPVASNRQRGRRREKLEAELLETEPV
jgi:transcriptional regulator with XRE-family HTH domain